MFTAERKFNRARVVWNACKYAVSAHNTLNQGLSATRQGRNRGLLLVLGLVRRRPSCSEIPMHHNQNNGTKLLWDNLGSFPWRKRRRIEDEGRGRTY